MSLVNLPSGPTKGNKKLIKTILIISRPKVGKTSNLMQLENSLLIDCNKSSEYFDGTTFDVDKESKKLSLNPISLLSHLKNEIKEQNKVKGGFVYKYGIIDTITNVEDWCETYCTLVYRRTNPEYKGKNVVTDLDWGAGYKMLRDTVKETIFQFEDCFETLILTGHVKDSSINIQGKSITVADIDLTGKVKTLIAAECDAIGTMYRDSEKHINYLTFKTLMSDVITGARPVHLSNKEFKLSEIIDDKLVTYWNQIFI